MIKSAPLLLLLFWADFYFSFSRANLSNLALYFSSSAINYCSDSFLFCVILNSLVSVLQSRLCAESGREWLRCDLMLFYRLSLRYCFYSFYNSSVGRSNFFFSSCIFCSSLIIRSSAKGWARWNLESTMAAAQCIYWRIGSGFFGTWWLVVGWLCCSSLWAFYASCIEIKIKNMSYYIWWRSCTKKGQLLLANCFT